MSKPEGEVKQAATNGTQNGNHSKQ